MEDDRYSSSPDADTTPCDGDGAGELELQATEAEAAAAATPESPHAPLFAPVASLPTPPLPDRDRARFIETVYERAESWAEAQIQRDFALEAKLEKEANAAVEATPKPDDPTQHLVNLTDLGNSRRLARRYGENLRFCVLWNAWMLWDGTRWVRDARGVVVRAAAYTVLAIRAEVASVQGSDEDAAEQRKAILAWSVRSESSVRINSMIELARSHDKIAVLPDAFDRDPCRINFPNGTFDVRFGGTYAHRRAHMITKCAGAPYDPCERAPRWERFLSEIMCGDAECVSFLQRAVGYSLLGDTSEHVMFVLHGCGANGKSVFLETLLHAFGDYASTTPFETFLASDQGSKGSGAANPSLASLVGRRLVVASEVSDGRRLDEGTVKSVTGGDAIRVRDLYEKEFTYTPAFKLWLACNHKPQIRGTDDGIWRRIRLIPFEAKFSGASKDLKLLDKLKAEASGILAWAIRGAMEWRKTGLRPPDSVTKATDDYRAESDKLGSFLEECCEVHPGDNNYRVQASSLFDAYQKWSKTREERPLNATSFGLRIKERGFNLDTFSKRHRWYLGIVLRQND